MGKEIILLLNYFLASVSETKEREGDIKTAEIETKIEIKKNKNMVECVKKRCYNIVRMSY